MAKVSHGSFAAGELDPGLHARTDLTRYQTGLALCRNAYPLPGGGVVRRPGTRYVCPAHPNNLEVITGYAGNGVLPPRLVPFEFNNEQTYILEFGDTYMRVIKDGGLVLNSSPAATVSTISTATPAVLTTTAAHGLTGTVLIYLDALAGGVFPRGLENTILRAEVTGTTTMTLHTPMGIDIDGTVILGTVTGGDLYTPYEIATPYADDDVRDLKFVQSADTMTLAHPSYAPRELTRTGHTSWTLSTITLGPSIGPPTGPTASGGAAGSNDYEYVVTAIDADTGEESISSCRTTMTSKAPPSTSSLHTFSWTAPAAGTVDYYKVYVGVNGSLPKFWGTVDGSTTSIKDAGEATDSSRTPSPQTSRDPFSTTGEYPQCVTYHQQRIVYAGADDTPQTIEFSQTGSFKNFNISEPVRDDDAISATLASRQVNEVRHLVSLSKTLLAFTSANETPVTGGSNGVITPSDIGADPESHNGSSDVFPIVINDTVLYVQERGNVIRDLSYSFETDGFRGNDLSVTARHLFDNQEIVAWAYARSPHSIIWIVMDDGTAVSLTYMREHQVWGFARHDTQGKFKDVAVVTEGSEDVAYFVVERSKSKSASSHSGLNDRGFYYIERMSMQPPRWFSDGVYADCATTGEAMYNGATAAFRAGTVVRGGDAYNLAGPSVTGVQVVTHSGVPELDGRHFTFSGSGVLSASGPYPTTYFTSGGLLDFATGLQITGDFFNGVTACYFRADMDGLSGTESTFSGIWHLEGLDIACAADGVARSGLSIDDGQVEIPSYDNGDGARIACVAQVGLPYTSQVRTLPIDPAAAQESVRSKLKFQNSVTLVANKTLGLKYGLTEDDLVDVPWANGGDAHDTDWHTETIELALSGDWRMPGDVLFQQDDPLPFQIMAVHPSVEVADLD